MTTEETPPPIRLADGSAWVASDGWRVPTADETREMRCRRKVTGRTVCGARPAAVMLRRHGKFVSRWCHCTDHAAELGHHVIDGVVRHRKQPE